MPAFDLKHIGVAKYNNNSGTVSYTDHAPVGDALTAALALTFAEGKLYAEGSLAEFIKQATGGTISIGVKYIKALAQRLMFGSTQRTRTVNGSSVTSLVTGTSDIGDYVGVSFYAPDKIDGVTKFTCVFAKKSMFGAPDMNYATKGESITFNTPTTTGAFMGDDANGDLFEVAIADTEADAIAWCDIVLGLTQVATPAATPDAGAVASGTEIVLATTTTGASIHYTTDGSTPNASSALYSADNKPAITAATTIKAVAIKNGMSASAVLTAAYTIS